MAGTPTTGGGVRGAVAQRESGGDRTPARPDDTIAAKLRSPAQRQEFLNALPAHVDVDRFVRVAMTTIRTNPKLAQCSADSILAGLMQAAQLGVEVSGVRGQAFLIPRWNKRLKANEASFQLGYRGMIDLAARAGITVDADVVHQADALEFERGTNAYLRHVPILDGEPGPVRAYYAVANFADDRNAQFAIRSVRQIEIHRDKFASSRDKDDEIYGPWVDHFDAMALKTVIIALLDRLPTSVELRQAMVADAAGADSPVAATYQAQMVGDPMGAIDVTSSTAPPDGVDGETGEIDRVQADLLPGDPGYTAPDLTPAGPAIPVGDDGEPLFDPDEVGNPAEAVPAPRKGGRS